MQSRAAPAAVQQRRRDARIGWVVQRPLPFDHVPVIGRIVRGEQLCRACGEIRNDRIQRNARTRDQKTKT